MESNPIIFRQLHFQDLEKIGEFHKFLELCYTYHGDYSLENIICAVEEQGTILAVGHLVPLLANDGNKAMETNDINGVLELELEITTNPATPREDVKKQLLLQLLKKASDFKKKLEHKLKVTTTFTQDQLAEIDMFLSVGFYQTNTMLIMKRDLTEPIESFHINEDIRIINWAMETEAEQLKYLQAEQAGDDQSPMSLSHLQWQKHSSEWDTFTAFYQDEVVGSVMTWGLSNYSSAVEQIFVLPSWRRKGIARKLITDSLLFLRDRKGKTEATLSVHSHNQTAIKLYKSLGYHLIDINIELGFDI